MGKASARYWVRALPHVAAGVVVGAVAMLTAPRCAAEACWIVAVAVGALACLAITDQIGRAHV